MDVVYIVGPMLLIAVVLAAVWLERWSVPVILVALGAGILFGSDVLNLWHFDDIHLANQVANIALVFILFQGGFSTKRETFKTVALPAGGLATWGVMLTAAATFGVLWGILHWSLEKSILLAVIISSTDAAATFSILRRQSLPSKLASTIEVESAANDPMAVLMTVVAVESFAFGQKAEWYMVLLLFCWKFIVAPLFGWFSGRGMLWLFNRLRPQDRGYYYVLSLGLILLIYGAAELIHASGMLAVFVAGYVMGNHPFVHKQGVTNFSSALSIMANIGMFALMGLLVFPHQWSTVWVDGIILFLVLTFVARPVAVWLGTLGMGISWKHQFFMMWAGLRGAVPIVLATYPATAGMGVGQDIFNLVFFAVLLSILIQGSTLGFVAKFLGLAAPLRPKPLYNLELITMAPSDLDLFVVDLPGPQGTIGPKISDLHLPPGSVITLITRGQEVVVPKGSTHLQGWDQVTVLARAKDEEMVRRSLLEPFILYPTKENTEKRGA
ncbi:MAG TPA: potassium/proton antiporter [Anaerohalosphaeraceae bacterium]|nr:potassium/proton antiporter [Anaerohalosphaeraceae bacterium]HRS72617.1 potassium/proton antiporter [Anaerohalosphaeraceae bacterium]